MSPITYLRTVIRPGSGRHRAPAPTLVRIAVPLVGLGVDLPPCYRDKPDAVRHQEWAHCPHCDAEVPGARLEDDRFLCTTCETTTKGEHQ